MKKLCLILISLFLIMPFALSQNGVTEEEIKEAGISPDNKIGWWLDRNLEKIELFLSRNKAEKRVEIAKERLAELKKMIAERKQEAAERAEQERVKMINGLKLGIEKMPEEQRQHVLAMINKHLEKVTQVRLTPSLQSQMPGLKEKLKAGLKLTESVRENIKSKTSQI